MSNVYSPPSADLKTDTGYGVTRVFAINGRIGRVRYYVYLLFGLFAALLLNAFVMGSINPMQSGSILMLKQVVDAIIAGVIGILVARRRLQDMDAPWAWSLLSLVPFVNFVFWLVLVFMPGTDGDNQYGPRPQPNTTGVIILAWVVPVLVALGILMVSLLWNSLSGARWY